MPGSLVPALLIRVAVHATLRLRAAMLANLRASWLLFGLYLGLGCSGASPSLTTQPQTAQTAQTAQPTAAGALDAAATADPQPTTSEDERPDASARPTAKPVLDRPVEPLAGADAGSTQPEATPHAAADSDAAIETPSVDAGPPTTRPSFFSTVAVEDAASLSTASHGDLWPSCWSDDDAVYTANGDGGGFSFGLIELDIVVSRLDGLPGNARNPLRGTSLVFGPDVSSVWSGADYNRKPTGMVCVHGELYLAVQDLRLDTYSDAPAATIVRSIDKGRTWSWDQAAPMFSDHVFTTIMFVDYGKDSAHAPDSYVYAYALDDNWGFTTTRSPPTRLYLARVPNDHIQDRTRWEFFAGFDAAAAPRWTSDIAQRAPVLTDERRTYGTTISTQTPSNRTVLSQGGILYNAALQRYIYTSWSVFTFEFYDAPQPWGPWTHFFSKDNGAYPWTDTKNGGYAPTLPSKFVSADGRALWMQSNCWGNGAENYGMSLRRVQLTPYTDSAATNAPGTSALASEEFNAVPLVRAARWGHPEFLNDGVIRRQSEDSWTGEIKTLDFWGYTWPQQIRADQLRYTTGSISAEGGWFRDLHVEVRQAGEWHAASGLRLSPNYAFDASVPMNTTFTLSFDAVSGDGFRIVGTPGGTLYFTSIAELGVFYTGQADAGLVP